MRHLDKFKSEKTTGKSMSNLMLATRKKKRFKEERRKCIKMDTYCKKYKIFIVII
jgi:hypothetical protein